MEDQEGAVSIRERWRERWRGQWLADVARLRKLAGKRLCDCVGLCERIRLGKCAGLRQAGGRLSHSLPFRFSGLLS